MSEKPLVREREMSKRNQIDPSRTSREMGEMVEGGHHRVNVFT